MADIKHFLEEQTLEQEVVEEEEEVEEQEEVEEEEEGAPKLGIMSFGHRGGVTICHPAAVR